MFRNKKEKLDEQLASDSKGMSTSDPFEAKSLFGAGSYKGYGLASMVEVLCGVYTGMKFGRSIPAMYTTPINQKRKLGQFYIVIRTDGCISSKKFKSRMSQLSKEVRKEPKKSKKSSVMLPNDKEILIMKKQIKKGIKINLETYKELKKLSKKFNLNF